MDGNSPHHGVSLSRLMDNAARHLAAEVARRDVKRILVVCGPGNNGGDGLAMLPHLPPGLSARILLSGPVEALKTPEARAAAAALPRARFVLEVFRTSERFRELAASSDLIVDALLGHGIDGDPREPIRSLVRLINASKKPVLSVDVPTGLGTRFAVRPAATVTFHDKKQGMTSQTCGRILVRDIGIPRGALDEVGPGDFAVTYRSNASASHKGQNGRVLVVAGGPYTGAPVLCAQAALRTGLDLVRLYTTRPASTIAQTRQPDLIVHPSAHADRIVADDVAPVSKLLGKVDVLVLGPGMGDHPETVAAIEGLLSVAAKQRTRMVLDADALVVAGGQRNLLPRARAICTPHAGEYHELTGTPLPRDSKKAKSAASAKARALRATLLVKGPKDIITDGRRTKVNAIHHPAMTTGGTGDVLAGIVAGLYSKGLEPFHAACAAAFVNGFAGTMVAKRQGGTLVATDLIEELPRVFAHWLKDE